MSSESLIHDLSRQAAAPDDGQKARTDDSDSLLWRMIAFGVVSFAVLCGVFFRWYHLASQSIWFDEGFTAFAASLSPRNVVRYAQSTDAPPLYFLLEHYWVAIFGNSEAGLRSSSALVGTLSIPVFYGLARKVLKDGMAVALAMWLFAFSIMQVWFSREARTYELASFVALVGLYALILFLERRTWLLFATIVLSIAFSLYLHNMLFFYLLGLNVLWITYPSDRPWIRRLWEVVSADALAVIAYLPWVPSLWHQVATQVVHKGFWASRPTAEVFFRTLSVLAGFSLDYLFALGTRFMPLAPRAIWIGVLSTVALLCSAMIAGGFLRAPAAWKRKNIALLSYGLIPVLAIFAFSRISTPLFTERIFTNTSMILPIVFALPLAVRRRGSERILYGILAVVLAVTTALSLIGYLRYQQKEDWRSATASVLAIPNSNKLVVFVARSGEILFDYYINHFSGAGPHLAKMGLPIGYSESFPPPRVEAPIESLADFTKLKVAVDSGRYSEIDLVLSHEIYDDPHESVLDYLSRSFGRQEDKQFYGVRVIRFFAPSN